jgi:hypothetical protein
MTEELKEKFARVRKMMREEGLDGVLLLSLIHI